MNYNSQELVTPLHVVLHVRVGLEMFLRGVDVKQFVPFEQVVYQSRYYHNTHSEKRDDFLIANFGEDWLKDMKYKGHFGGDWCPSMIGQPKGQPWKSSPVLGKEIFIDKEDN